MPSSEPIEQTISGCLSRAEKSSEESLESRANALQTLSSLTKVSSHNRTLLAQSPGAIASIVSLSTTSSTASPPVLQALSLSILFNLSLNPILKHPLASSSALLRHLNSLMLSPSSSKPLAKLAASLVCSLAMLDKNKAALGVAGTVEAVVEAVGTAYAGDAHPARHHLLSSLAELVQFHGNCTLAVRAGAVPVLVGIVTSRPCNEFAGSAYAILGLLARFEEGIAAVRAVEGVVEMLVEALRTGCMSSKESALDILGRLFEGSEERVGEVAAKPEFSSLLADLSVRGSVKVREKAGELMRVVMEANLDCCLEANPCFLDN